MPGNLLDRPQILSTAADEAHRPFLYLDVPHLRNGSFSPVSRWIQKKGTLFRGSVYACAIFLGEFITGSLLKKRDMCPWDYSKARWNIDGVIRLDYAPVWFFTGLLYEKIFRRL